MDIIAQLVDVALHLDRHLAVLVVEHGLWVYAVLFAIVLCETGLVIFPFLPGDSLLFVAGALAAEGVAGGGIDIATLIPVLLVAAVLGDNLNYFIGRRLGSRVLHWGERSRLFNRKAHDKTRAFYDRHGAMTMMVARFIVLVRTFAPFVAGVARMDYARYFFFDFIGAILWVFSLTLAGYWFGNIDLVKDNLGLMVAVTFVLLLSPLTIGWLRHRRVTAQ